MLEKIKFILEKLIKLLTFAVVSFVIGLNIYYLNASVIMGNPMPIPFGYGFAVILSGSMEPELSIDDIIMVKEKDHYEVGDIVVFQKDYTLVVHRIIKKEGNEIITKGDANNIEDSPITEEKIKGIVVKHFEGAGEIVSFIKSPLGLLTFFSISGYLYYLTNKLERIRKDKEIDKLKSKILATKYKN